MFDRDATREENLESLRTCIEGTGLVIAEGSRGKIKFGHPPCGCDREHRYDYYALSGVFTAKSMDEARAFALGVREGRRAVRREDAGE